MYADKYLTIMKVFFWVNLIIYYETVTRRCRVTQSKGARCFHTDVNPANIAPKKLRLI